MPATDGLRSDRRWPRRLSRQAERGVEVGSLDDPDATHLLLRLGVGAIGHRDVITGRPHDRRGRRRVQTAGEHPSARPLQLIVERRDLRDASLRLRAGEIDDIVLVVPHGQQVLGHRSKTSESARRLTGKDRGDDRSREQMDRDQADLARNVIARSRRR
jgi:hypothetical protein